QASLGRRGVPAMTVAVTREEFEARVGVLERGVEGEKVVTRYILEQSRRNGDDLAAVKSRLDRLETRLDRVMRWQASLMGYAAHSPSSGGICQRSSPKR